MRKLTCLSTIAVVGSLVVLGGCSSGRPAPAGAPPSAVVAGASVPAGVPSSASAPRPSGAAPASAAPAGHASGAPPAPVAAAKLPGNAVQSWQPIAAAQNLPTVHDVPLNECQTIHGARTWQQQGYQSSHDTPAIQDTFVFADAATADAAYQNLGAAMAGCQAHSRSLQADAKLPADATVTQTARSAVGVAWVRQWTGVGGISAPGSQTNHIYLVHHGTAIAVLQITDLPGKTPSNAIDVSNDGAVLGTLQANLGA
jgi:hypothetical protein